MLQFLNILSLTVFGTMDLDECKIQHKMLGKILLVFGGFLLVSVLNIFTSSLSVYWCQNYPIVLKLKT